MATTEGLRRQRRGGGQTHVTGSGISRPLAMRILESVRRTRGVLAAALALCCSGLVAVAGAVTITEFHVPTPNSFPVVITTGPDGALWFTEVLGNKIGRITATFSEDLWL